MDNLLEARGLSKSFGSRTVFQNVSLSVSPGEGIGIVGENGAGKSTLLKILVGLLAADRGTVSISGRTGYCPQEPIIFSGMTVEENFLYFATAYGLTSGGDAWLRTRDELLEKFGFSGYINNLVDELSGGTSQKLNLSMALLHRPAVLFLDEPYSGFDWETYLRFWEYVDEIRVQRRAVVIVSHFVNERSRFDRIYNLKDGVLVCEQNT